MNKFCSISLMLFKEIWLKPGPDQVRNIVSITAGNGFLRDASVILRLLHTKVDKHTP